MKTNKFFTTCLLMLMLIGISSAKAQSNVAGTYGVSIDDPSNIRLVIHPDNTFTYTDHSNSKKMIDVSGTWLLKGKKLVLKSSANTKFHNRWKIIGGKVAKSRRGLCFYRICKLD